MIDHYYACINLFDVDLQNINKQVFYERIDIKKMVVLQNVHS